MSTSELDPVTGVGAVSAADVGAVLEEPLQRDVTVTTHLGCNSCGSELHLYQEPAKVAWKVIKVWSRGHRHSRGN